MYIPRWFKEDRLPVLQTAIERIGFGTLVTVDPAGGLVASHIPMMIDRSRGDYGVLYGHIARGNHQWRDTVPDAEALAMFVGPDDYISPTWYQTKVETGKVVPTWNYVAVHVYGPVAFFEDADRLREVVTRLTDNHEAGSAKPWSVDDAPREYIDGELRSIVGFEMQIRRIEGKWKLSQNRSEADRKGAIRGLTERGGQDATEVAAEMTRREVERGSPQA